MKTTKKALLALLIVTPLVGGCALLMIIHRTFLREHIDGFGNNLHEWKAYGGSWELTSGGVRNDSDERGAKLITGSPFAGDYIVEADVAVLGNYGDSGIIVRARDIGRGVDSYQGFFAGLRTLDNALLFGRADYGWIEYKKNAIPGDITVGEFYHLRIAAVGCMIAARVDLPNGQSVREGVDLVDCVRRGQVGLKSYQSPGMWKNFRVTPATQGDLLKLMDGTPLGSSRSGTLHTADPKFNERGQLKKEAVSRRLDGPITVISDVPLLSPVHGTSVSVHGIVTLISPMTYVEDQTGGIAVLSHDAPALAIGDEVEISGTVEHTGGEFAVRNGHVKTLGSNTFPSPPMITADEAATGTKDGHLVVLSGQLIRWWASPSGRLTFELESRGEVFRAVAEAGHYDESAIGIRPDSEVQIVGVVSSRPEFAGDSAFALLISPNEDSIRVVKAATWWTPAKIAITTATCLLAVLVFITFNHQLKERRMVEASKEREMLAHDLHDTVSQSMAGIGFQLASAAANIAIPGKALNQIKRARDMVKESHEELRRSLTTLRTELAALEDLANALEAVAIRLVGDGPIEVVCAFEGKTERLPLAVADCFFRVGQEAISNAVLHAGASLLKINLLHENRRVTLRVSDNGPGFYQSKRGAGLGIYGMAKRAEMIGAHFKVVSNMDGTAVILETVLRPRFALREVAALFRFKAG